MSNAKIWVISIILFVCGWLFVVSAASLAPVLSALCIAYFIFPFVLLLETKLKLRRVIAVALALSLIIGVIVLLGVSVLPPLANQTMALAREISTYSVRIIRLVDQLQEYLQELGLDKRITGQLDDTLAQLFAMIGNTARGFVSSAVSSLSKAPNIVILVILLFYFLLDGQRMISYIVDHSPGAMRESIENILACVGAVVWGYMKNQVIISIIFGAASAAAYLILGLPYVGLLGLIAGVLNMIPYFGSIISVFISVIIAALYLSMQKALLTLIATLLLNVILGNIITPRIQAKTLGIHPVVIITALLVCNYLWGAIGMFFAVPIVGLGQLVMFELIRIVSKL